METELKVALVGAAGQQGQEYYKLLENSYINAVVDSDFSKLSSLYSNEKHKLKLFSNIEEAVKNADFNVAIVCLPHFSHADVTLCLLKHNKIIIKEKPLALSLADVKKYSNERLSPIFTVVQRQFNPVFTNAKKDLCILDKIYSYTYEYSLNLSEISTGWRSSFECAGGGVLIDMGYHALDIILSFFGKPEKTIAGFSYCYDEMKKARLEDSACLLLQHKQGHLQGLLNLNRHHSQKKEELEIVGQNGIMIITPKSYKIVNRKNQLVKEFILEDNANIKSTMFQTYFQQCGNQEFVKDHFEHHSNIVEVIENSYFESRNN